jgi:YihY family inner membrane protein
MNPFERALRRLDAGQQRFGPAALVFGVMKKFGDDNGGILVANLAYSALVCVFPLLLIGVTVLSVVLANDPHEQQSLLHSTFGQFPLIGNVLSHNIHGLHRSSMIGLIVGILALVWGTTSLAQAGLFSMSQIWNLPGPDRPNYLTRLARSGLFLAVLGIGVAASSALAGFGTFGQHEIVFGALSEILAVAVNVAMYLLAFRVLTPKKISTRHLLPGAVVGGVAWTLLQALGGYLIGHDLRNDSVTYGVFAAVLGLIAWTSLGARITIYAAETNTVLARHLWPRGMVQPPLTEADQRSMALQATQNQRRPEQKVSVEFSEPPMTQSEWLVQEHDDRPAPVPD